MVSGITVGNTGSYKPFFASTRQDLDSPNGDLHLWFLIGLRATTDP